MTVLQATSGVAKVLVVGTKTNGPLHNSNSKDFADNLNGINNNSRLLARTSSGHRTRISGPSNKLNKDSPRTSGPACKVRPAQTLLTNGEDMLLVLTLIRG